MEKTFIIKCDIDNEKVYQFFASLIKCMDTFDLLGEIGVFQDSKQVMSYLCRQDKEVKE